MSLTYSQQRILSCIASGLWRLVRAGVGDELYPRAQLIDRATGAHYVWVSWYTLKSLERRGWIAKKGSDLEWEITESGRADLKATGYRPDLEKRPEEEV